MKVFLERCRGRAVVTPTPIETTTTTAEPYAATVDQVPDVTEAITANSSAVETTAAEFARKHKLSVIVRTIVIHISFDERLFVHALNYQMMATN